MKTQESWILLCMNLSTVQTQIFDRKIYLPKSFLLCYMLLSSMNSKALPSGSLQNNALLPPLDMVKNTLFFSSLSLRTSKSLTVKATCLSLPTYNECFRISCFYFLSTILNIMHLPPCSGRPSFGSIEGNSIKCI